MMRLQSTARTAAGLMLMLALYGCSDAAAPPEASEPVVLADVSLGTTHSCAVMSDGVMSCWGYNGDGRLGPGTSGSRSWTPVVVPTSHEFTAVAAGGSHTCGLTSTSLAVCWGRTTGGPQPLPVGGSLRFQQLAAGSGSTCGLDLAGAAYCWAGSDTPVPVPGEMTFRVIEMGMAANCALTAAGAAWCWGGNGVGSLGDGTSTSSSTPVAVAGGHVFTQIDLGSGHACALKEDGSAWCWGDATHGQMGDGRPPSTEIRATPVAQRTPVRVASDVPFIDLAVGERFACGLALTGTWCWGYNSGGQLGDGSTMHRGSPVAVGGGRTFAAIYAGGYHACARGMEGLDEALFCWGDNMFGQLGVGTMEVHRTPVRVKLPGEG